MIVTLIPQRDKSFGLFWNQYRLDLRLSVGGTVLTAYATQ